MVHNEKNSLPSCRSGWSVEGLRHSSKASVSEGKIRASSRSSVRVTLPLPSPPSGSYARSHIAWSEIRRLDGDQGCMMSPRNAVLMEASVAAAKLIVMYPTPKDLPAFEHAYSTEHIPMAAPIFQAAGASKVVLTKVTGSPGGTPAFHRVAEIHFPSLEKLQACAASKPGQDAVAHPHKISNGGAPVLMIAEEEVVTF